MLRIKVVNKIKTMVLLEGVYADPFQNGDLSKFTSLWLNFNKP